MNKQTLFSLFSNTRKPARAARPSALRVESLEDRQLLSATDWAPVAEVENAEVESVEIAQVSTQNNLNDSDLIDVSAVVDSISPFDDDDDDDEDTDLDFLDPPTSFRQTGKTDTSVTVEWYDAAYAEEYHIWVSPSDINFRVPGSQTSATISGLTPNTDYNVRICTENTHYGASEYTSITATTDYATLATPSNIKTTVGSDSITLTWDSVGVEGCWYWIYYKVDGGNEQSYTTTSETSYTITGLKPNTTYALQLNADANAYHESAKVEWTAKTEKGTLATPTNVSADSITSSSFVLSWDAVPNAEEYIVTKPDGSTVRVTDTTYTVENLNANTEYSCSIKAVTSSEDYNDSENAKFTATTDKATLATPELSAESTTTSVTVSWNAVPNATGYVLVNERTGETANITGSSYTFNDLHPNAEYPISVTAYAEGYYDSSCVAILARTQIATLDAPTIALSADADTLTVSWEPVSYATTMRITLGSFISSATTTVDVDAFNYSYTFTDLEPSTNYFVQVCAQADGFYDSSNAVGDVKTERYALSAPKVFTYSAGSNSMTIYWDAVENAEYYEVANKALGIKTTVTAPQYAITGLTPDTSYTFQIKAKREGTTGSAPAEFTAKTSDAFDAPTGLIQTSRESKSLAVAWKSVSGAESYRVTLTGRDSDGNTAEIATAETSDLSYEFTGLTPDSDYVFSVCALGTGTIKDSEAATLNVGTSVLTDKAARPRATFETTTDSITLTWDPVDGALRYMLQYKVEGAEEWTLIRNITDTSLTLTVLEPNTTYTIRMKTIGDNINYKNSDFIYSTVTTDMLALDNPTGLEQTGKTTDSVTLKWDAVENAETYCAFYYRDGETIATWTTDTTCTISGLDANSTYAIFVYALADGYAGSANSFISATTQGVLTNPTKFTYEIDSESIALTWDAVENADHYMLQYKAEGAEEWTTVKNLADPSYEIGGLEANTNYTIRVKAVGDGVNYKNSNFAYRDVRTGKIVLATPTNFAFVSANSESVTLKWDAVENAEQYLLYFKHNDKILSRVTTDTTYTVGILNHGSDYTIYLAAGAEGYEGSDPVSIDVSTKPVNPDADKLAAPELTVNLVDGNLVATWTAVDTSLRYLVGYKAEGSEDWTTVQVWSGTSYTIENVDADANYTVRVKAVADLSANKNSNWTYVEFARQSVEEQSALDDEELYDLLATSILS